MKPLRLAVLGAGLVGRRHIETVRAMPQAAELLAVVDPVADPSQFDLGDAAWFTDMREMLDQVRPEAIIIATPNNLHAPQGLLACERGIHFLVEKPVTATLDEAELLVDAVARSGVKTLVGHHRRYLAVVQRSQAPDCRRRAGRSGGGLGGVGHAQARRLFQHQHGARSRAAARC